MTQPKIAKKKTEKSKLGFTLVEVAIVLAVVGLVMGGMLVPIGNQLKARKYEQANEQTARIVDAIVGYAIANRSSGLMLAYETGETHFRYAHRSVMVPTNRPHLPCPDSDGDGYEDRMTDGLDKQVPLAGGSTVIGRNDPRFTRRYFGGPESNHYRAFYGQFKMGRCFIDYWGDLPWRTLGLESGTDPWGNPIRYWGDPIFTMAGYGFDQHTRARAWQALTPTSYIFSTTPSNYGRGHGPWPVLPCSSNAQCSLDQGTLAGFQGLAKAHELGSSSAWSNNISNSAIADTPDRLYARHQSLTRATSVFNDALPFVVWSAGQNGDTNPNLHLAHSSILILDRDISIYRSGLKYTVSRGRAATSAANLEGSRLTYDDEIDDVTVWLTRREFAQRMYDAGVFPIEPFEGLETLVAWYDPTD